MLRDCISKDRTASELFVVPQGKMANLAREGRDRMLQAVLPAYMLKSDLSDRTIDQLLEERGIFPDLVMTLGVGIDLGQGFSWNLEPLRYGKIVLVADDSPRRVHFVTETIAIFRKYFGPLVEAGHVFTCSVNSEALESEEEFNRQVFNVSTRQFVAVLKC